ncbi:MAG: hypothetical protein ACYCVO_03555, partial [Acidimicrobiales bacterium]
MRSPAPLAAASAPSAVAALPRVPTSRRRWRRGAQIAQVREKLRLERVLERHACGRLACAAGSALVVCTAGGLAGLSDEGERHLSLRGDFVDADLEGLA